MTDEQTACVVVLMAVLASIQHLIIIFIIRSK